ncbi:hypothetical protein K661_02340 [Piscirickettsia salmonis LF-89 = ATCC VR-1361]|nr:hypothetical protein K661_02340 [Piscirickettsia salmonis LF-89 = ATCC VR-1361]
MKIYITKLVTVVVLIVFKSKSKSKIKSSLHVNKLIIVSGIATQDQWMVVIVAEI